MRAWSNGKVVLEHTDGEQKVLTTDGVGKCHIVLEKAGIWYIHVGAMKKNGRVQVPPRGKASQQKTMTYNPTWEKQKAAGRVDRSGMTFTEETQRIPTSQQADMVSTMIHLKLYTPERKALPNYPVTLTCLKLKTKYHARTNGDGIAVFKVPKSNRYEVDIDGIESFKFVEAPPAPGYTITQKIIYQPLDKVNETEHNDTILQKIPASQPTTSARTLVTVSVKDYDGEPLPDETIYFRTDPGVKVYAATTNAEGVTRLLIPKGSNYVVGFKYTPEFRIFDNKRIGGIGEAQADYQYIGSKVYEERQREQKRLQEEYEKNRRYYAERDRTWTPELTGPPVKHNPPTDNCRVFFTGLLVGGYYENVGVSETFKVDQYSEYVGYGEHKSNARAFPKAVQSTFDGIAVGPGTRLIIYSEQDFKGEVLLDVTGPILINNKRWKDDSRYNVAHDKTFPSHLQALFPPAKRMWSKTDMHQWSYGSCKIICAN